MRAACDGEAIRARRMVIRAPQTVGCCQLCGIMSTIDCRVCVKAALEEDVDALDGVVEAAVDDAFKGIEQIVEM